MFYTRLRLAACTAVLALAAAACDRAPTLSAAKTSPNLNSLPVARVNLTVLGSTPCSAGTCYNYRYDALESYDPDGTIVAYEWKEYGNVMSTSSTYNLTAFRAYESCTKPYQGTLKVTDNTGATATACYSYAPA